MTSQSGPAAYGPIERPKVYELVAERILHLINDGMWQPGHTLPRERELALVHGVGRSSVREALRILESRGLIDAAGKGAFVVANYQNLMNRPLTLLLATERINLQELYETRKLLEVEAAGLAAVRGTEEQRAGMQQAVQMMTGSLTLPEQYIQADIQFHWLITLATGNRMIAHFMGGIREILRRAMSSTFHIPGGPARSIDQHQSILHAIVTRSSGDARLAMLEHLSRVEADIKEVLIAGSGYPTFRTPHNERVIREASRRAD